MGPPLNKHCHHVNLNIKRLVDLMLDLHLDSMNTRTLPQHVAFNILHHSSKLQYSMLSMMHLDVPNQKLDFCHHTTTLI